MAIKLSLREMAKREDRLGPGHRLCAGCGAPIVVRQILNAIEEPVVVANATGCLEVSTTIYPYTAWRVPWIHNAFENAAATIAGVEAMYRSLVKQGKIEDRNIKFIAFGGDGGTYDIGIQALSGAAERGHKFLYVCVPPETELVLGDGRVIAIGDFTEVALATGQPETVTDITGRVADTVAVQGEVAAWNHGTAKVKPILRTQRMPAPPELVEVETVSGAVVRLTPEHPVLVDGLEGPTWKPASELMPGDEVYTPRLLKTNGNGRSIYLIDLLEDTITAVVPDALKEQLKEKLREQYGSVAEAARQLGLKPWQWEERGRGVDLGALKTVAEATMTPWTEIREAVRSFRMPGGGTVEIADPQVNADLLYLLGLIASDGHISSQRYLITLVNTEQALLDAFATAHERCFAGRKVSRTHTDSGWHYTVCNPLLWMAARALDIKHNPAHLVGLSPDLLASFLRGVFDGDGHASIIQGAHSQEVRVLLCTTDLAFSQRLCLLLQRLGIASQRIRHSVHCDVWISSREDIERFIERVGTQHPLKRKQLAAIRALLAGRPPRGKHFSRAPRVCGPMLKALCEEHGVPVSEVSKKIFSLAAGTERTTKRKVREYLARLAERAGREIEAEKLEALLSEDFFLDPVRCVERKAADCRFVYDITVAESHTFVPAGGFVISNCYDNGAYMNTGIQRSSATPLGAWTTTSPVGRVIPGKTQFRKDLTAIMVAHNIPYVAQAAPHRWKDLMTKAQKGVAADGPAFLNVLAPCNRGWRMDTNKTLEASRLAVETCYWPLFEVENGQWKLNYKPREKLPVEEWLKTEGRFKHLFEPQNRHIINELQAEVDRRWERLLRLCGEA